LTDIFIPLIVFILFFLLVPVFVKAFPALELKIVLKSLFCHTFFAISYYVYSLKFGADSIGYYSVASQELNGSFISEYYGTGTTFIYFLLYPFANSLGLSYLSCTLLFNFIGFIGLWFFYISVLENLDLVNYSWAKKNLTFFMFLPGLNFWTSAIGKDSLMFFSVGLLFFGISRIRNRFFSILISMIIIFHIRPHIFLFVSIALVSTMVFSGGKSLIIRIVFTCLVVTSLYFTMEQLKEKTGLEDAKGANDVLSQVENRANYNLEGTSSYEISQFNLPFRVATYLYRPIFVDARSLLMFVISFENALFVLLSLQLFLWRKFLKIGNINPMYIKFCIYFFLISVLVLSAVTSNMGIAIRQKMMFMPCLLALYCIAVSKKDTILKIRL
jgi:hypothetical protein